jgi:predicted Rossmann fold nucleotide-binding protein DprA/Smf involved in DNA uptake
MVQSLQSNPESIASELLQLELAGRVKAQPGLRWRAL